MNEWQQLRQLEHRLTALTWPDRNQGKVLRGVRATPGMDEDGFGEMTPPYCLIRGIEGEARPQKPDRLDQGIELLVVQQVFGDRTGRAGYIGGNRDPDEGSGDSDGRGLLEVCEEVVREAFRLSEATGFKAALRFASKPASFFVDGAQYHSRVLRFKTTATIFRYYARPQDLAKSGSTVSWRLDHLTPRWDFWKVRLARKAGTTPPTLAELLAGSVTEVTIADPTSDTSVSDSTSGEWAYSIFAVYDEAYDYDNSGSPGDGDTDDLRYSDAAAEHAGTTRLVS